MNESNQNNKQPTTNNKQQTSLNIIAIAVFSITLLSLLGPVLNISPTIPAAITFGIMGLITIDTLSWENKGVTLFLDLFAGAKQRERILHHEAGHFLVAYLLEIPITGYTLTAWEAFQQGQPGLGGVTFDLDALKAQPIGSSKINLILERFCTVWMAGIAAEKLLYGNVEGGRDDKSKVMAIFIEAGLTESICLQKQRWGQLQATTLIENNRDAYDALVAAMQQRLSVSECINQLSIFQSTINN